WSVKSNNRNSSWRARQSADGQAQQQRRNDRQKVITIKNKTDTRRTKKKKKIGEHNKK
uniref:Uncharacterized protein n=2 Tax=Ixodes scapularis TaxID=6945 RepID=A0A1S4LE85_IXOSC